MTVVVAEIPGDGPITVHADGDDWELRCGLTLSSTYKTGGDESFKPAIEALLKQQGTGIVIFAVINGAPGYYIQYNYKTGKLQVFEGAAGVLKELAEAEYPALLRETGLIRCWLAGR